MHRRAQRACAHMRGGRCAYVHVHLHTHLCAHTHAARRPPMRTCVCAARTRVYAYTSACCLHVCAQICVHIHLHACAHATCARVYVCIPHIIARAHFWPVQTTKQPRIAAKSAVFTYFYQWYFTSLNLIWPGVGAANKL